MMVRHVECVSESVCEGRKCGCVIVLLSLVDCGSTGKREHSAAYVGMVTLACR